MEYILTTVLLTFAVSLFSYCTNKSKESHEENTTDTICVNHDSIFTSNETHFDNSTVRNIGLKGHVKSISIPTDENSLYFPFDYIEFNEYGDIYTINKHGERLNIQNIYVNDLDAVVEIDFDEEICWSTLHFDLKNEYNKTFNYNSESFDLTYTILYSPDGDPMKIVKVEKEAHYEVEGMRPTEETETFDVRIVKKDDKGNWLTLSLNSPKSSQTINRHIQYFDDNNEIPKLTYTGSRDKVLFSVVNEYDNQLLRYYDKNTGLIHKIIPPDYEDNEAYGYKDYKLVGNRLYLILLTGASGAFAYNLECAVYSYNIETDEWKEIGYCGYGCEIVDNKIKMPFYDPEDDKNYEKWYEMK